MVGVVGVSISGCVVVGQVGYPDGGLGVEVGGLGVGVDVRCVRWVGDGGLSWCKVGEACVVWGGTSGGGRYL